HLPESERNWHALHVDVDPTAREAVEYALMEAGALGTETAEAGNHLKITAYFASVPDTVRVLAELSESLRIYELPDKSVGELTLSTVADRDWLEEWKKSWEPVVVDRFLIAPSWTDTTQAGERIVIRIEPGMAFGTGTHETTRLCLKAIARYFRGGSFLDVGTGTGILAIAAAKLRHSTSIEACDTDADAIQIARENAELNDVADQIVFRTGSVDNAATSSADLVCANLTADVIASLLPELISATCGRLILSGILDSQLDSVLSRLREVSAATNLVIMQDGEWVAIVV